MFQEFLSLGRSISKIAISLVSNVCISSWGISFHDVVVFGLGKNFLFKSALGHCEKEVSQTKVMQT